MLLVADLLLGFAMDDHEGLVIAEQNTTSESDAMPQSIASPFLGWVETAGSTLKLSAERLAKQSEDNQDPEWVHIPRNNLGFVSRYNYPPQRIEGTFYIMVVGGSVARWFALQGEKTFLQALKTNPFFADKNIVLLNAASGGFKQPQQLNLVTYLLINGFAPDMLINLDGFNEAALSYDNASNRVTPSYPSYGHWSYVLSGAAMTEEVRQALVHYQIARDEMDAWRNVMQRYSRSNIITYAAFLQYRRWQQKMVEYERHYRSRLVSTAKRVKALTLKGPLPDSDSESIVSVWLNASKLLYDVAKTHHIAYFHFLQPTAHDPDNLKPMSDEEHQWIGSPQHSWAQGIRMLYPRFKTRSQELRSYGVRYYDLSGIFEGVENSLYYDICHFNQQGNIILAQAIARAIASSYEVGSL